MAEGFAPPPTGFPAPTEASAPAPDVVVPDTFPIVDAPSEAFRPRPDVTVPDGPPKLLEAPDVSTRGEAPITQSVEEPFFLLPTDRTPTDKELEMAARYKNSSSVLAKAALKLLEVREEANEYREEARTDTLTGIPNRRGFDEGMKDLIVSVEGQEDPELSMVYIDLDNFKEVNDTHADGHEAGDLVLKIVADILTTKLRLRGGEVVGRLGGDEFALGVVTENQSNKNRQDLSREEMLDGISERMKAEVAALAEEIGMPNLGVSIGAVSYRPGETYEQFRGRADAAMKEMKDQKDYSYRS